MQDKNILVVIFIIIVVMIILLVFVIAFILSLYQKKQNLFFSQLELVRDKYEKELLKSQLEVQEQTLQDISRELHDNIGQFMTLAKLQLNTVDLPAGTRNSEKIFYSVNLITKALEDLRNISKSLSLEVIRSAGLSKAIEGQINQILSAGSCKIDFKILGNYNYMEEQKEIIIFRMLQEALNNILRHAEAKIIQIRLECSEVENVLLISDDGKGFTINKYIVDGKIYNHNGGLSNMFARAKLIDAMIDISSVIGKGTTVIIKVPLVNVKQGDE